MKTGFSVLPDFPSLSLFLDSPKSHNLSSPLFKATNFPFEVVIPKINRLCYEHNKYGIQGNPHLIRGYVGLGCMNKFFVVICGYNMV